MIITSLFPLTELAESIINNFVFGIALEVPTINWKFKLLYD